MKRFNYLKDINVKIEQFSKNRKYYYALPVCRSPAVYNSDDVFVYEKPTPGGALRKSKFVTANRKRFL